MLPSRAARMASQGTEVINFGIGRPDFDTPAHIKAAAKEALDAIAEFQQELLEDIDMIQ